MKKIKWHRVAEFENEIFFQPNGIAVISISNKQICFTKFNEQFFAFAFKCPHAGGIMAEGTIDANGNVVCPIHRYRFNIKNGNNSSGEGFYLKTWKVEQREDGIYIGMEEGGFFDWLG